MISAINNFNHYLENRKVVPEEKLNYDELLPTDTALTVLDKEKGAWAAVAKALCAMELPKDFFEQSLYSPLQAAVLLQDLELCKRMVELEFSINSPEKTCKHPPLAIALGKVAEEIENDLEKRKWKLFYHHTEKQENAFNKKWARNWNYHKGSEEIALYLIEKEAELSYHTSKGFTYLHLAIGHGYEKVCKLLLEKGVDVNKGGLVYYERETPLQWATQHGNIAITRLLLENGASYPAINFNNCDCNPFYIALKKVNEELIQVFLDHGEQLDQEIDWIGDKSSLLDGVDKPQLYKLALKLGIKLERKFGISERTYLHLAAASKHANELIPILLQKGANARVLDNEGYTPLARFQIKNDLKTHADLEKADKGLNSLMCNLRLLGLRYSFKGAAFEGILDPITYAEAANSLENHLKNQDNLPPFFNSLPRIIRNSSEVKADDILSQIEHNGIVSIASGWKGIFSGNHATAIVLTKHFLIKCNRGDHCGKESGVTAYKIKNPLNLSEVVSLLTSSKDVLDKDCKLKTKDAQIEFFNKRINDLLDLEKFFYIPQKCQTVGNCAWYAARMAVQGCVIAHHLQENPSISIEEVKKLTNPFFSSWKESDYLGSLEILEKIENEPIIKEFIDIEKIYDELFILNLHKKKILKKLCQLRPRLREWINNPDPKLMSYGYSHAKARIIKLFFDRGVKPDLNAFLYCNDAKVAELNCDYFIKQGIKASIPDESGWTPLHIFCIQCLALPEIFVPLIMKLIEAWKRECELTGDLQPLKEALNIVEKEASTAVKHGLTPLQYLTEYSEDLAPVSALVDLMKKYGATVPDKS